RPCRRRSLREWSTPLLETSYLRGDRTHAGARGRGDRPECSRPSERRVLHRQHHGANGAARIAQVDLQLFSLPDHIVQVVIVGVLRLNVDRPELHRTFLLEDVHAAVHRREYSRRIGLHGDLDERVERRGLVLSAEQRRRGPRSRHNRAKLRAWHLPTSRPAFGHWTRFVSESVDLPHELGSTL